MATDKLRIMGKSNIKTPGKAGSSAPKRKIEDPFKDDDQGPPTATISAPVTPAAGDNTSTDSTASEQTAQPTAVPSKPGRSRLILAPKKKPKTN